MHVLLSFSRALLFFYDTIHDHRFDLAKVLYNMTLSSVSLQRYSRAFVTTLHPLAKKDFSIFWAGAFLSSLGFWIQTVGQGWQVLQLTNSAFLLGLVTLMATLP